MTIAIGFSNGANIAASILFLRPDRFQRAILFTAMISLVPDDLILDITFLFLY